MKKKFIQQNVVISEEMRIKNVRFRKNNIEAGNMRAWVGNTQVGDYSLGEIGLTISNHNGLGRIIPYEIISELGPELFAAKVDEVIKSVMGQ